MYSDLLRHIVHSCTTKNALQHNQNRFFLKVKVQMIKYSYQIVQEILFRLQERRQSGKVRLARDHSPSQRGSQRVSSELSISEQFVIFTTSAETSRDGK